MDTLKLPFPWGKWWLINGFRNFRAEITKKVWALKRKVHVSVSFGPDQNPLILSNWALWNFHFQHCQRQNSKPQFGRKSITGQPCSMMPIGSGINLDVRSSLANAWMKKLQHLKPVDMLSIVGVTVEPVSVGAYCRHSQWLVWINAQIWSEVEVLLRLLDCRKFTRLWTPYEYCNFQTRRVCFENSPLNESFLWWRDWTVTPLTQISRIGIPLQGRPRQPTQGSELSRRFFFFWLKK